MRLEQISREEDKIYCASLMADYEPWVTMQRTAGQALGIITDPTSEVFLVKEGDQIIGFTILRMKGAFVGYIQSILIIKEFQRMGYGTKLIAELEKYIFSRYPNVFICASSFNPGALKLYKSLNYEVVGNLNDFIVKGHSEILLRKSIGPIAGFKQN